MRPHDAYDRRHEIQLLDVREDHEWRSGHIDDALHIPMRSVPDHLGRLDRDRTVVTVCRSGNRSQQVADYLNGNGFRAANLDGGMRRWVKDGLPITTT